MIAKEILGAGFGSSGALAICGSRNVSVTATGTTQAAATVIGAALNVITTCTEAACGVILTANDVGDSIVVCNATSNNLRVYPPVGGAFSGGTVNVPFTMAPNSTEEFFQYGALNFTN